MTVTIPMKIMKFPYCIIFVLSSNLSRYSHNAAIALYATPSYDDFVDTFAFFSFLFFSFFLFLFSVQSFVVNNARDFSFIWQYEHCEFYVFFLFYKCNFIIDDGVYWRVLWKWKNHENRIISSFLQENDFFNIHFIFSIQFVHFDLVQPNENKNISQ